MVYLDNTTSAQTVWIPRNDEGEYIHTGSSGSYKEGFADGYESGVTDGYGSGYTSGHTDGMDDQKELLSSTTFTENGVYTREDGWSSVTVYVTSGAPQSLEDKDVVISADTTTVTPSPGYYGISAVTIDASEYAQENYDNGFDDGFGDGYASGTSEGYDEGYQSGYTSGSTDGFNSGYTSGETHQKSLLGSMTATTNGSFSAENGYSSVTVNTPTYNIEANKPYTATTNGSYSIKPSVYTTVNDSFENGVYRITFEHSGYPTNEVISVLRVEDFSDPTKGYVDISIVRGQSSYYIGLWSGGTVYRESLTPLTLRFENANEHYGWVKDVGYIENYDAMSAVSLNVNVPMPNIEQNKSFTATSNGNYTITPTTYTSDVDLYRHRITIDANDYPNDGYFRIGYLETRIGLGNYSIEIYLDDGEIDYDDSDWKTGDSDYDFDVNISGKEIEIDFDKLYVEAFDGDPADVLWYGYSEVYDVMSAVTLTVDVPQTGSTSVLGTKSITGNGTYNATSDNLDGYSAVTVNVDTASTYYSGYSHGYQSGYDIALVMVENSAQTLSVSANGIYNVSLFSEGYLWNKVDVDIEGTQITLEDSFMATNGVDCFYYPDKGYFEITESESGEYKTYTITKSNLEFPDVYGLANIYVGCIRTDEGIGSDYPLISVFYLENYYGDNEFFIEEINDTYSGNTTWAYTATTSSTAATIVTKHNIYYPTRWWNDINAKYDGIRRIDFRSNSAKTFNEGYTSGSTDGYNSGYTSGFTDGYNSGYTSGYTDGENDVISTFSALTATTNGIYGTSAHPYSSVTVNVPQTAVTVDLNPAFIDRSITDIIVPTACTKVGRAAFSHCESARTITIPDTVTFIDVDGFSHCHRVTGITFGNGIEIIGAQAFDHCGDLLAQGETINNGHIILPDSVKRIRDDAFYSIDNSVTAITFGSGTTNLGDDIIAGSNINEIYSYATTAPQREAHIITSGGTHYEYYTFRGMINATGTVHYPNGSDYSSWQNDQYLSGWTFVGDL